jgi:hypothetical protein
MSSGVRSLSFVAVSLLLLPASSFAQVEITEVMYDLPIGSDSGREWIEVYNTFDMPQMLTDWKLYENGTNHKITTLGPAILPPKTYAVIAENPDVFKIDWPQYAGLIFDSTFNLSNSSDTIGLKSSSTTAPVLLMYASALGANGDGNSLNREPGGSTFSARAPSPGSVMSATAIPKPTKDVVPQKTKTTNTASTGRSSSRDTNTTLPDAPIVAAANVAAPEVITHQKNASLMWFLAAAALALCTCIMLIVARHIGKREWQIVEDKSE